MRPCAAGRARKTNVSQKVPPPEPRKYSAPVVL
jgi:hypothetical protein